MAATTGEGSSKNTFNQIIKRNGQFGPKKFLIKFNAGAFFFCSVYQYTKSTVCIEQEAFIIPLS